MSRESEARIIVEQLDNYLSHTCQDYGESDHEAMMMAIEALEQQDRITQILDDCDLEAWEILEKIKEAVRV
jgi:hypothetical protein